MKRLIGIMVLLIGCLLPIVAQQVQPKARLKKEKEAEQKDNGISVRAQTQYPVQADIPDNIVWKREIYRTIDLTEEANMGLYDPAVTTDERMNLFAMIFKLLSENKIPAYEYRLDGEDVLTDANKINFKDVLDRYHLYYKRMRLAYTHDTVFVVNNSDIPSNEVMSYFLKEVWYFDSNSNTFGRKVLSICPVLHRSGDFSFNVTKYPMFWVKYADIEPYLSARMVMTSPLNNATQVSLSDFFSLNMYQGSIYKAASPSGKTLSQYCTNDTALAKEQARIEKQLADVENSVWIDPTQKKVIAIKAVTDSLSSKVDKPKVEAPRNSRRSVKKAKTKKVKSSSSSSSNSGEAKISVRRQRR